MYAALTKFWPLYVSLLMQAAEPSPSAGKLAEVVLASVVSRTGHDGRASVPDDHTLILDDEAFRGLLDGVGVPKPAVIPRSVTAGRRTATVQSWRSTQTCRTVRGLERCAPAAQTTVVRLLSPQRANARGPMTLDVGVYHRAVGGSGYEGTGGIVFTYVVDVRKGEWVVTSVKVRAVS